MFTKKIALLGLASLTALSVSCSDTDDDKDIGGEFNPALEVIDAASGVEFKGKIVATDGNQVKSVKVTANGTAVDFATALTLPAATVNLDGEGLKSVCTALNNTTTIASLKIVVTAEFDVGEKLVGNGTLTNYSCGTVAKTPIVKKTLTLSGSGNSYGNIDGPNGYKKGDLTEAIAKTIDLAAFTGLTGLVNTKVYTPSEVTVEVGESEDIFWDLAVKACPAMESAFGEDDYDDQVAACKSRGPYDILGYVLPNSGTTNAVKILDDADYKEDINEWVSGLEGFVDNATSATDFEVKNGTGFLLYTSEGALIAATVSSASSTAPTTITFSLISTDQ